MLVATLVLAITSCLVKKDNPFVSLIKTFALACLIGLGVACGNYKNNFGGFTVLTLFSILPMFATTFDLKSHLEKGREAEVTLSPKQEKFYSSNGNLFAGVGIFLGAICLSFAGLYKGYETFYGFGIGLAIGFAITFLALIFSKKATKYDFLGYLLTFTGTGLFIAEIITIGAFSLATTNLIACAGLALLAVYSIFKAKMKFRFADVFYFVGMIALFATLLF